MAPADTVFGNQVTREDGNARQCGPGRLVKRRRKTTETGYLGVSSPIDIMVTGAQASGHVEGESWIADASCLSV